MKTVFYKILVLCFLLLEFSCEEEITDCPNSMCLVAGEWRLTEVYIDEQKDPADLSLYRLILNMPINPEDITSAFSRVQANGTADNGSWSLQNNDEVLRLIPEDNSILTEDWIIKSMTPRKLVLIITRDTSIKNGPGKIEMVLEPF